MKTNRSNLIVKMLTKFGLGFLVIGLLLFLSAGRLSYINGWIFIFSLAIPMAVFGFVLLIKNPTTLERRLSSKEADKKQGVVVALSGIMFIASFVTSGLDYRFSWSNMPLMVTYIALVVMLLGYAMFVAVLLQNSYAARVVDVYEQQKLITEGLYSLVRHPMYLATLLIFLPMPLILGSWFGLLPMLFYPVILVQRINNEEALLTNALCGYGEYLLKTKYKLLPFIW